MIFQIAFGDESIAAAFGLWPVLQILGATKVDLAADESQALMYTANMDLKVGLFDEGLVTPWPCARDVLALAES